MEKYAKKLQDMLSPRELYNAMGFPPDYIIDRDYMGNPYPKNEQVARCGNAVCPPMAAAVARANFPEYVAKVGDTITTMNRNLNEAIFDIAKVEAIMFAFENTYLELDVAPADRARADMATDAFYALRDAIRKVSDDLDRLAGDCRVVDAIYAVNDVRRRVGTLKTED